MKKIAIFDVDGVLLDLWAVMKQPYSEYVKREISDEEWDEIIEDFLHDPRPYFEFGNFFDNSPYFDRLPPTSYEMIKLVTSLKLSGFDLAIITSIKDTEELVARREENIRKVYGSAFSKIICVGRGNSKEQEIVKLAKDYDFSMFCDDTLKNAAKSVGLVTLPVWYENKHNLFQLEEIDPKGISCASNAKELKELIISHVGDLKKF